MSTRRPLAMRLCHALVASLLLGPAATGHAAADEVILNAETRVRLKPNHPQPAIAYPVTIRAELIVARNGSARDVRIDATAPSLLADAVRAALSAEQAFWPAQGQCRFLEQRARVEFAFGAPEQGAPVSLMAFEPGEVLPAASAPIPQADALFVTTSADDQRWIPPLEGHPADETPPVALGSIKPRIPDELRHYMGYVGYVWLTFEATAKGHARDIEVHDAWSRASGKEAHLGAEAVRALRAMEFKPATRAGQPISRRSCFLLSFGVVPWLERAR